MTPEELACLPVFPLPRVVFFPGTALPLHLFETRYQQMVEDCMTKGPKALAVTLLEPGWEDDYDGDPPVHEIAGVGRIVGHQARPDGTHDIILQGLHRVRLEELPSDHVPYRLAKAIPLEDSGTVPPTDVLALMSLASSVAVKVRERQPDFTLQVSAELPPGRAADIVADQLVVSPDDRQRILEAVEVEKRVSLVTTAVGSLLAQLSEAQEPS